MIGLIFSLLTIHAYAMDLGCSHWVDDHRFESAGISTWPTIKISRAYAQFYSGEIVDQGTLGDLANSSEVCFRAVKFERDCQVSERTGSAQAYTITLICKNGTSLEVDVSESGSGIIRCLEGRAIKKSWDVGYCEIPRS
jgi:hypothetical protein